VFIGKSLLPDYLQKHEFKFYVLVLFISRILIPLLFFELATGFTAWLYNIALLMNYTRVDGIWTPYPFLTNFLIYFMYSITFNDYILFSFLFFLFNSLSDIINGIIIWTLLKKSKYKFTPIMRWLYAYSPVPIIYISIKAIFDPYIVMILLLSIYFIKIKKTFSSSLLTSIGTSLKLFPICAVLSYFLMPNKKEKKFLFYSFILLISLNIILLTNPALFLSSYYWQLSRPAWGSVFSILSFLLINNNISLGTMFNEFFNNESILELIKYGILGITPEPALLQNYVPLQLSYIKILSFIIILLSIFIFAYFARKKKLTFEKSLIGILSLFFVFSFGFSPQYLIYILILLFIILKPSYKYVIFIILLQILSLLEYPIIVSLYFLNILPLNLVVFLFYLIVLLRDAFLIYIPVNFLVERDG